MWLRDQGGWWWAWLLHVARLCREPAAKRPRDGDVTDEESGMSDDLVVVEVRVLGLKLTQFLSLLTTRVQVLHYLIMLVSSVFY